MVEVGNVATVEYPMQLTLSPSPNHSSDTHDVLAALARLNAKGGGTLALQGSHQLEAPLAAPPNTIVRGDGTAVLNWTKDLGSGVAAVTNDGVQGSAPRFEDIHLVGPGVRNADTPVGATLVKMDGFAPGPCVRFTNCTATQFRVGFRIRYDHNWFIGCRSNSNYFNVLFDDADQDYGNHTFYSCYLEGALFASVGVAGGNLINASEFIGTHFGFGPYGFYKSDTLGVPSTKGFIAGTKIEGCSFEAIGNAAILDESTGGPGGQDSLFGTSIINPGFSWNDTYRIPSRPKDYAVQVRRIEGSRIWGGCYPFTAGDKGVLSADFTDLDWDLGRDNEGYAALFGPTPKNIGMMTLRQGSQFQAGLFTNGSGRTIRRGEPMELGGGWYQANAVGTQGRPFFGVAMHDAANGAAILVGFRGLVMALCEPVPFTGTPMTLSGKGTFTPAGKNDDVLISTIGNGGAPGGGLVQVMIG